MTQQMHDTSALKAMIESAFERRADLDPEEIEITVKPAVEQVVIGLEAGRLRHTYTPMAPATNAMIAINPKNIRFNQRIFSPLLDADQLK